ncbi:MAG: hypothetical protein AB7O57_06640 [Hyphomicrobiaceae bacterium]
MSKKSKELRPLDSTEIEQVAGGTVSGTEGAGASQPAGQPGHGHSTEASERPTGALRFNLLSWRI